MNNRVAGWVLVPTGLVVGLVGVVMAWGARLHNAIVARVVDNPWPGYVVAAVGIAMVAAGVLVIMRTRPIRPETPTPGGV